MNLAHLPTDMFPVDKRNYIIHPIWRSSSNFNSLHENQPGQTDWPSPRPPYHVIILRPPVSLNWSWKHHHLPIRIPRFVLRITRTNSHKNDKRQTKKQLTSITFILHGLRSDKTFSPVIYHWISSSPTSIRDLQCKCRLWRLAKTRKATWAMWNHRRATNMAWNACVTWFRRTWVMVWDNGDDEHGVKAWVRCFIRTWVDGVKWTWWRIWYNGMISLTPMDMWVMPSWWWGRPACG